MKQFAAVAVACLTIAQCVAQNSASIIGRWRSLESSKGGIGAMYEFAPDGTVRFSPGATVEILYRVENGQLVFPPAMTNGPESRSTVSWTDENHFHMITDGQDAGAYRREGARTDAQNALMGEWIGSRTMDGKQLEERMIFGNGPKMLLLIKFLTQQGRYSVTNGRLVATFNGQPGLDGPIEVVNGVLSIRRSGGRVTKLIRY